MPPLQGALGACVAYCLVQVSMFYRLVQAYFFLNVQPVLLAVVENDSYPDTPCMAMTRWILYDCMVVRACLGVWESDECSFCSDLG